MVTIDSNYVVNPQTYELTPTFIEHWTVDLNGRFHGGSLSSKPFESSLLENRI